MRTPMDSVPGTYWSRTLTSLYDIDLDARTLKRTAVAVDVSAMRRDAESVTLIDVLACTVGDRMQLIADLHIEGVPLPRRTSTYLLSIEKVVSERAGRPSRTPPDRMLQARVKRQMRPAVTSAGRTHTHPLLSDESRRLGTSTWFKRRRFRPARGLAQLWVALNGDRSTQEAPPG